MLRATLLVVAARFGADERLRRAVAVGHVGYVEIALLDRSVQVLAALFADAEAVLARDRFAGERLQLTAI